MLNLCWNNYDTILGFLVKAKRAVLSLKLILCSVSLRHKILQIDPYDSSRTLLFKPKKEKLFEVDV